MLSVAGLSIRFGGLVAIRDMTFEVREGEVLSLIGPNGAGKTTAFNAITGYLRPSTGERRNTRPVFGYPLMLATPMRSPSGASATPAGYSPSTQLPPPGQKA